MGIDQPKVSVMTGAKVERRNFDARRAGLIRTFGL
jgi:hypothetical protein